MAIYRNTHVFQARTIGLCFWLARVLRNDNAANGKAASTEDVHKPQNVIGIGNANIASALAVFNVVCVDGKDNLCLVSKLLKHLSFCVWSKSREDASSVVIVEQFTAKLKVELAAKFTDTLVDSIRLHSDVLLVIKADTHASSCQDLL